MTTSTTKDLGLHLCTILKIVGTLLLVSCVNYAGLPLRSHSISVLALAAYPNMVFLELHLFFSHVPLHLELYISSIGARILILLHSTALNSCHISTDEAISIRCSS